MANVANRTGEHEIAFAIMKIAESTKSGCVTYRAIRHRIARYIDLTDEDLEPSESIQGEPKWHQIIRNITSNRYTPGNFIYEGFLERPKSGVYCITRKGRRYLKKMQPGLPIPIVDASVSNIEMILQDLNELPTPVSIWEVEIGLDSTDDPAIWVRAWLQEDEVDRCTLSELHGIVRDAVQEEVSDDVLVYTRFPRLSERGSEG